MLLHTGSLIYSSHCQDFFRVVHRTIRRDVWKAFNPVRSFRSSGRLFVEITPRTEIVATSSVYTDKTGMCMPAIVLGTWKTDTLCKAQEALIAALKIGYRAIDTSAHYGNEEVLGLALRTAMDVTKLCRDDLFLITKLPFNAMRCEKVNEYLCKSLKSLKTEFVDLYMINFPAGSVKDESGKYVPDTKVDHAAIWKGMEEMVDKGKTKYLGVCNFNCKQLNDLIACAKIMPSNVQVEVNVYFQDESYRKMAKDNKITVTAFAPLGRSPGLEEWMKEKGVESKKPSPLHDPCVSSIARKVEKNNGQVLLRYLLQLDDNLAVVIGASDPTIICENFDIFNFCIDNKEFCQLKQLDKGKKGRLFDKDVFKLHFPGVECSPDFPWPDD